MKDIDYDALFADAGKSSGGGIPPKATDLPGTDISYLGPPEECLTTLTEESMLSAQPSAAKTVVASRNSSKGK